MRKIALVGCAKSWAAAPFDDPSWQIWAHASCQPLGLSRVDRWFDLHRVEVWRQGKVWYKATDALPTYVSWLSALCAPIVMQQHYLIVPTSEAYPLRAVVETFGIVPAEWAITPEATVWWDLVRTRGEFTSTAAYMLALALYEGVDEIALFGIDFIGADELKIERAVQRAGMKYWVGFARALDVPVTVSPGSYFEWNPWLYGYERHETPVLEPQELAVSA